MLYLVHDRRILVHISPRRFRISFLDGRSCDAGKCWRYNNGVGLLLVVGKAHGFDPISCPMCVFCRSAFIRGVSVQAVHDVHDINESIVLIVHFNLGAV